MFLGRERQRSHRIAVTVSTALMGCAGWAVSPWGSQAAAQDLQDLNAQTLQQFRLEQQRQEALRRQLQPVPDVRLSTEPLGGAGQALPPDETPCFSIGSITVEAAPNGVAEGGVRDWQWLAGRPLQQGAEPPVVGSCLGARGVAVVMARMQQALVERGWITTRVVAPPQDLSSGELLLQVLEGQVGQLRFAPDSHARATLFNTIPASEGQLLNLRDLEQALENFRRVPTVQADLSIEPGAEPGTSDLVVRHRQNNPFRVLFSADDSGSKSTGKYQGALTLSYDNWWTLSDLLYITLQSDLGGKDPGARGTRATSAHYSVPWGHNLISLNTSSGRYFQTVAGALEDYVYRGTSHNHDVRLSRVVQRDQAGKTTAGVRAFHRRSRNFIDDTEVEVQRRAVSGVDFSVGHRRQLRRAQWDATLTFRRGIKAWGWLPAPEEVFGEGTSLMRMWLLDASVSVPLDWGAQRWVYQGTLRVQRHHTPLTPQDRFSIGSRYTVRGFDGERSLSADSGWLWRNEWATPLGQSPYSVYAALDLGGVSGPAAQTLLGKQLVGAALGLRARWSLGPSQTFTDVYAAWPLKKPDGFGPFSLVLGFALSVQF
jgi:hemolysin activation/secretion protein